jgi:hypothetical protein
VELRKLAGDKRAVPEAGHTQVAPEAEPTVVEHLLAVGPDSSPAREAGELRVEVEPAPYPEEAGRHSSPAVRVVAVQGEEAADKG